MWGRIAWLIAQGALQDWDIETFLALYRENQHPLILSDGLPTDAIPVPLHWQSAWQARGSSPSKTIPWETYLRIRDNPPMEPLSSNGQGEQNVTLWRVAIDRESGRAVDGALRSESAWIAPQGIIIFALAHDVFTDEHLQKIFHILSLEGWGNMRSSGNGAFRIQAIEDFNPQINSPDGFMLLAHCHPTNDMPEGLWKIASVPVLPHHPQTGRAVGPFEPMKRTIMLAPGSSFKDTDPKPFYGRMLSDHVEGNPQYLHYGIAPALPIKLLGNWNEALLPNPQKFPQGESKKCPK